MKTFVVRIIESIQISRQESADEIICRYAHLPREAAAYDRRCAAKIAQASAAERPGPAGSAGVAGIEAWA